MQMHTNAVNGSSECTNAVNGSHTAHYLAMAYYNPSSFKLKIIVR